MRGPYQASLPSSPPDELQGCATHLGEFGRPLVQPAGAVRGGIVSLMRFKSELMVSVHFSEGKMN